MNAQQYKYVSIALLIVVLILGWMLLKKQPATEAVNDATMSLAECRVALAGWIKDNRNIASASVEARTRLDTIIKDCQQKVGDTQ